MPTYHEEQAKLLKNKIAELACDCKSDLKHLGYKHHQVQCASNKILREIDAELNQKYVPLGALSNAEAT